MKRQGQASNSSGLGRIAPLPDSNPTRGRLLCNREKTMGRNVNLGLTEPYLIPVPEKSFRMLDAAKIAPPQIDYPGIGDTMVAP